MVNQYSVDFKLKIVKMILNESISKREIERSYKVSRKAQRQWVHKYKTEGTFGDMKQNDDFRRVNHRSIDRVYKEFALYAIGRNINSVSSF